MGTTVAIDLLFGLLDRAAAVQAIISKARAEGREVSEAELDALTAADDVKRDALIEAIRKRRAEGG